MFAGRYYAGRYFPAHYFPQVGETVIVTDYAHQLYWTSRYWAAGYWPRGYWPDDFMRYLVYPLRAVVEPSATRTTLEKSVTRAVIG